MGKIVTVVGATGSQGGSVVQALLEDSSYSIRAITRNSKSDAAKSLASKGVEVVEADINNPESLQTAFAGSYAIFAVTNFFETFQSDTIEKSMEVETKLGISLAKAAADTESLQHYVWSSLPNSKKVAGGKTFVPYYESKNEIDRYIQSIPHLWAKATIVWFGWYGTNIAYPFYQPNRIHSLDGAKRYVQFTGTDPSGLLPMLGDVKNTGIFIKSILDQPEKTRSRFVTGLVEYMSLRDVLAHFAAVHGIEAHCVQISQEDYLKLFPHWGELMNIHHNYAALTGDKSFSSVEDEVLTKDDLNVKGLIGTAEAMKSAPLLG